MESEKKMKFKIKCKRKVYDEYGRIMKFNLFHLLFILCVSTPGTNWLIPFFKRFNKIELCRITLHNKEV
jgi:hypothetical protein